MTETPTPSGLPDGRTKKLRPRDWLEICNLASSGVKVPEIAATYGMDTSVIYKGLKKRHVNVSAIAAEMAMRDNERQRNEMIAKIREAKDRSLQYNDYLEKRIMSELVNAQKAGLATSTTLDGIKALKLAMDAIAKGRENKWAILGLDKENDQADAALPDLPIRVLTEEETNAMRERQDIEDGVLSDEDLDAAMADLDEEGDVVSEDEDSPKP
jgi:predicted DNA-binding protein YlxM (UPF0122 family)